MYKIVFNLKYNKSQLHFSISLYVYTYRWHDYAYYDTFYLSPVFTQ